MEVSELNQKLTNKFERIWRCADSNKWDVLKKYNLLTFNWIDKKINYTSLSQNEIGPGKRAIYADINSYNFGLESVLMFLNDLLPDSYNTLVSLADSSSITQFKSFFKLKKT